MRIYISGEKGNLAMEMRKQFQADGHLVCPMGRGEIDFTDPMEVEAVFSQWKPELVIHAGAIVGSDRCENRLYESINVNVNGTALIAEACRDKHVPMIYFSSSAVYDPVENRCYHPLDSAQWIDEYSRLYPRRYYPITKLAGEHLAVRIANATVLRPAFIFGGQYDTNSMLMRFIQAAARYGKYADGKVPGVTLDSGYAKPYMHISDFSDAMSRIVRAIETGRDVPRFMNISREEPVYLSEVVRLVEAHPMCMGPIEIEWQPNEDHLGNHKIRSQALRAATGWDSRISLEKGIDLVFRNDLVWDDTRR